MAKKLKNVENEKQTLHDLEYGEKTEKRRKSDTHTVGPEIWGKTMKKVENETHTHCRTWNLVRNTKNEKNEIYKLQELKYGEKSAKRENEKCILQDLEYGDKTEIQKMRNAQVRPEIW